MLSATTVKSYSEINSRPACPVLFDPNDPDFANGFIETESEWHNAEHGTPDLDLQPLMGHTNHEFQGVSLQQAVETTVQDMYNESISNRYTIATERFADILRSADNTVWEYAPDAYVAYVTDYAYVRMMEAFEYACVYEGAIDNGSTTLADEVIDVQEAFITLIEAETDPNMYTYNTRFKYSLDLATTHWLIEDHGSATTTLTSMQAWTTGNELDITNSTLCRVNYEHDVLEGTIPLTDVGHAAYPCQEHFVLPKVIDGEVTGLTEELTTERSRIDIFPNPTAGQLTISFSHSQPSTCTFEVYDNTGKEVLHLDKMQKSKLGSFLISTDGLENGIYYIKALSNDGKSSGTFSVQR